MKNLQKGFVVPLLIAVIALLVIGGGVYIYKNKKIEAPTVDTETDQQTNTQTPTLDITGNWKKYTDNQNGFTFQYTGSGYGVEVIKDITTEGISDGACSSGSPEIYKEDKRFVESNPIGTETNKIESLLGLHKIYKTASETRALVSVQTCQGIAEDDESAASLVRAEIFKGNILISLNLRFLFNGNVKVKDIRSVAQDLLKGTFKGPEQESFNQFVKTISTFKFTK